ncbi:MAG TPA: thioredoxin [Cytophagaceae bacterium]|jgi:thioredoxin 1|nr:thioredoxin [Cytophagaceae bacterium]
MAVSFDSLIKGSQLVLVDFYATWCGPCKTMAPILEQVASSVKDRAKIIKIDVDRNPVVASTYRVQGVPTLVLFKEGKVLWRQSGVIPAPDLEKVIQQFS